MKSAMIDLIAASTIIIVLAEVGLNLTNIHTWVAYLALVALIANKPSN